MMRRSVAALLLAFPLATRPAQEEWRRADPDYDWSFPRDHWPHAGFKTEWWYLTGLLESNDGGARYGYQFTIFKVGLSPDPRPRDSDWSTSALFMGHAAITDPRTGRHLFSEVLYRLTPFLAEFRDPPDSLIAWSRGPAGTDSTWRLAWTGSGFSFGMRDDAAGFGITLTAEPSTPPVMQGPNGYSRKHDRSDGASMYYSYPRMATAGQISVGEATHAVRGTSWMDKEFSSDALGDDQVGWDWFGLRLDDGRAIMLYRLRSTAPDGDVRRGTLARPDGSRDVLAPDAWTARPTATWKSSRTDATYPTRWTLDVDGLVLDVRAVTPDQENVSALVDDLFYWEGVVEVLSPDGRRIGEGYAELTGYGSAGRPAI